jgi:hypothetical protein
LEINSIHLSIEAAALFVTAQVSSRLFTSTVCNKDRKKGIIRAKFRKNESVPHNIVPFERPSFHDAIGFNYSSRGREESIGNMQFYNQCLFLIGNTGFGNKAGMQGQPVLSPALFIYLSFGGQLQTARIKRRA